VEEKWLYSVLDGKSGLEAFQELKDFIQNNLSTDDNFNTYISTKAIFFEQQSAFTVESFLNLTFCLRGLKSFFRAQYKDSGIKYCMNCSTLSEKYGFEKRNDPFIAKDIRSVARYLVGDFMLKEFKDQNRAFLKDHKAVAQPILELEALFDNLRVENNKIDKESLVRKNGKKQKKEKQDVQLGKSSSKEDSATVLRSGDTGISATLSVFEKDCANSSDSASTSEQGNFARDDVPSLATAVQADQPCRKQPTDKENITIPEKGSEEGDGISSVLSHSAVINTSNLHITVHVDQPNSSTSRLTWYHQLPEHVSIEALESAINELISEFKTMLSNENNGATR
jgi:hypothetical protein